MPSSSAAVHEPAAGQPAQTIAYAVDGRLYLNVTNRCTLACAFCPRTRGEFAYAGHDLRLAAEPDAEAVAAAVGDPAAWSEVVFCGYGEPTLRLDVLLDVARAVKAGGGRVRVVTDGLGSLANRHDILPELRGAVDALSVSLNAQSAAVYELHCRPTLPGAFPALLEFLQQAPRHVPEITATAVEGLDGVDIDACARLARACGARFRARPQVEHP